MEPCHSYESINQGAGQAHQSFQLTLKDTRPRDSVPVIHCVPVNDDTGLATQVAAAQIGCSGKGVGLHANPVSYTLAAVRPNDLRPMALFKKARKNFLSADLARHLLLAVLQI